MLINRLNLQKIFPVQDVEKIKRMLALFSIRRRLILATSLTIIIGVTLFYRPTTSKVEIAVPVLRVGEVGISLILSGAESILHSQDRIDLIATTVQQNIVYDDVSAKSWTLARNVRVIKSISQNQDVRALLAVQEKDVLAIAQARREGELDFLLLPDVHE
jgi:hypothetical protein